MRMCGGLSFFGRSPPGRTHMKKLLIAAGITVAAILCMLAGREIRYRRRMQDFYY